MRVVMPKKSHYIVGRLKLNNFNKGIRKMSYDFFPFFGLGKGQKVENAERPTHELSEY